jgi:gliding motility-associated-like protein
MMLFCCEAKTQTNLVYNGDFEIYDMCITNPSTPGDLQIEHCLGWTAPTKLGTSDYFNVCNNVTSTHLAGVPKNFFGYQMSFNGDGYCGFLASVVDSANGQPYIYREYVQTKLIQPLTRNKIYNFSFYASNCGESTTHSLIKIGALFSSNSYLANNYMPIIATPQIVNKTNFLSDTLNWMKIEGSFIANGNEEFLTIGYFENKTLDTLNNHYDPFNPYYKVVVYYYIDGVSLVEFPCDENVPNVFTPNNDKVNDTFKIELCDTNKFNLVIYNRWGIKMFETNKHELGWDGHTTSGEECSAGTYFFIVNTENKNKKGFIQLVR